MPGRSSMSTTRKYDEAALPEGWRMVRVGDLVGMSQGGTPRKEEPSYWDGAIPFLTGADLTDFRVGRHHARSFLTAAGLASGQTARCESGTLLLTTRTRVGLAGMATELMGASQDITCLVRIKRGIKRRTMLGPTKTSCICPPSAEEEAGRGARSHRY